MSLLAVNAAGHESGNDDAFAQGALPLLQDDAEAQVWSSWQATWRDVQILDADNTLVGVYNLTDHDLADPDNYAALRSMLVDAAGGD